VSCQEAFPIVFGFQRLEHLFAGRQVRVFTDHKNLAHIFEPSKETPKTTLARLQRWALLLQAQWYKIDHIDGKDNIVADLFSRWGVSQRREIKAYPVKLALKQLQSFNKPGRKLLPVDPDSSRRNKLKFIEDDSYDIDLETLSPENGGSTNEVSAIKPILEEKMNKDRCFSDLEGRLTFPVENARSQLELPSVDEVLQAQAKYAELKPAVAKADDQGILRVDGKIWLPINVLKLVIITSHALLGHPGATTLADMLKEHYWSSNLLDYCKELNSRCLHCTGEHTPNLLRRKWSEQFHTAVRNGILHMDFLYIRNKAYRYVFEMTSLEKQS
jgi:hypothetical protein